MGEDLAGATQLEYMPSPKQQRAHCSPATYVLYGGALGGGKSVWLVNEMLQQALDWAGNVVGIFRWENTTFKRTTYVTMQRWILDVPGLVWHHNKQEQFIELKNGSIIRYGGIKPSASVGGEDPEAVLKSLELGACGIDEVTEVIKRFYDTLCGRIGRLAKPARDCRPGSPTFGRYGFPKPKMACTCNPEPGWAKLQWVDQQLPDHEFIQALAEDNPDLPADYIPRLYRLYPKEWVDKYLKGDWSATTVFDAVWPYEWLLGAAKRKLRPDPEDVAFGLDVATYGNDRTVCIMRRGYKADILLNMGQQNTVTTRRQVQKLADKWKPHTINVDYIGVGCGVCDQLQELGYNAVAIVGGAKANDPTRFVNMRAELHWELRLLLEKGKPDFPNDSALLNEMGPIKYLQPGDRKIQIESKEAMRRRGISSPNMADAMVYAFAGKGSEYLVAARL